MNGKEKILNALNHKSGPVPLDFGSTAVTGMHVSCVAQLRDYYDLENRPVKVHEPYQMLGLIEPDLLDALGADCEGMMPASTMFGFPLANWKPWVTPWGQNVLVPGGFNITQDAAGIQIYPEGDLSAPASGRMPAGSFFFDAIVRQEEFDEDALSVEDNLQEFSPISEDTLIVLRAEAQRIRATDRAVVGGIGGTALGDIALVPAPFLKYPKGIRAIEEWYVTTAIRRDFVHELFSRQVEIAIGNLEKINASCGDCLDVIFMCGTDFGTQSGSFCSPDTFDELWLPYYRRMNDWIHDNTQWKTFKHSCGAVENFVDHFIEAGFDILNPVQCSATGMDPQTLKDKYGDRITFWGGGVDTQHTLPFGTPDEVRVQVLERCRIFSPGGGFIFNAIHNVQANTPVENIVALVEAVRDFNGT
jgi:hypothetical protein